MSRSLRLLALAVSAMACVPATAGHEEDVALLALLKSGGQVVLMRHTIAASGVGDPPHMTLTDCSTQRNLTDEGRRHAKAIAGKLRAAGVEFDQIATSPLCRCKETAHLMFGRANEVMSSTIRGEREVREMRAFAAEKRRGNAILISHASTILHAVGVTTEPGDMVIITPQGDGGYAVRGKLVYPER